KDSSAAPTATEINYGEVNLRLTDGTFFFLLNQPEEETIADPVRGHVGDVQPLDRYMVSTSLQASATYIAEALDVPIWYDSREK
ncbi:MAG: hypothetical protein AAF125_21850, partial [Chloroflexota bacterium]